MKEKNKIKKEPLIKLSRREDIDRKHSWTYRALAIIAALMKAKPATAKGTYILSCTISGTMTPGVKINTKDLARATK